MIKPAGLAEGAVGGCALTLGALCAAAMMYNPCLAGPPQDELAAAAEGPDAGKGPQPEPSGGAIADVEESHPPTAGHSPNNSQVPHGIAALLYCQTAIAG